MASDVVAVPGPPFVITNGKSNNPKACSTRKMTASARVGRSSGTVIRQKVDQPEEPSTSAAS
jgi:hypothetical protein